MKTEKMSFRNIKDVLSRDEMKSVMAGSGGGQAQYCASLTICLQDAYILAGSGSNWRERYGVLELGCYSKYGAACAYGGPRL